MKKSMLKWAGLFFLTALAIPAFAAADAAMSPSSEVEVVSDRLAQRLELIRNQMELTIVNHEALESDLSRQKKEIMAFDLFLRIPTAKGDAKSDKDLLKAVRADLERAAVENGFKVRGVKFASKWRTTSKKVPDVVPFDEGFRATEDQIVDQRDLVADLEFDGAAPADTEAWLKHQQDSMNRLMVAKNAAKWKRSGKRLSATLSIFRFRDFQYPGFVAPDLSRYVAPATQSASAKRIQKYRREIVELWPKVQPHLNDVRAFAMNDLRMSFFLKRVNVQGQ